MNQMPVNKGYDNIEEYLAVVLTNIYMSDKGQDVFRANHVSGTTMRGADADNFLHNSQTLTCGRRCSSRISRTTSLHITRRLSTCRGGGPNTTGFGNTIGNGERWRHRIKSMRDRVVAYAVTFLSSSGSRGDVAWRSVL
jgi:hypothetical protein